MQLGDVHSEAAVGRQRFSRQFEQDSLIHSCKVSHIPEGSLSLTRGAIYGLFWYGFSGYLRLNEGHGFSRAGQKKMAGSLPAILCLRKTIFGGVWLDLGNCPHRIADFEASEPADAEVLAQLANLLRDQVFNGERLILDERLIQQANFL